MGLKVLITGGAGFLGHHMVEHILKKTDWDIVIWDKLTYASMGLKRLRDIKCFDDNRVLMFNTELCSGVSEGIMAETGDVDFVIHLAAETHVDRSIVNPVGFVLNNVKATLNMLEYARVAKPRLFVNFSTDEVFGPAPDGYAFPERAYHFPSNPYSASKSSQEALGIAYSNTFGVPVITTHTMNLFGERQHPEKFIPLVISRVLRGQPVVIHANKDRTRAGSRYYIHCRNLCDALLHIVDMGYNGYDEWNIAGLEEVDNLTLARKIADIVGKPLEYEMTDFHGSRPGHDLRYALDSSKLIASGYTYPKTFEESLRKTVEWTLANKEEWL